MAVLVPFRKAGTSAEDISDEGLIAAVAEGDKTAFGLLYDRFHRHVFAFLASLAGTRGSDLDDWVQITFCQAYRSAARFSGRSSVKTWLFGVAVNVFKQQARRDGRRLRAFARLGEIPVPPVQRPDEDAEARELVRLVARAIAALPDKQRIAYLLCVVERLPAREVARVLGVRESSLWRRVHDAREVLKQVMLKEEEP